MWKPVLAVAVAFVLLPQAVKAGDDKPDGPDMKETLRYVHDDAGARATLEGCGLIKASRSLFPTGSRPKK